MFGRLHKPCGTGWLAGLAAGLALALSPGQASQEFNFKVLLDDREIGFHRFEVAQNGNRETIDIEANFEVTFFAIPFYRYGHSNQEVWRDGCLESIRSQTDDNGDVFRVEGRRDADGFSVSTQDQAFELDGSCVMTFAYWNAEMLDQQALLNSQTGEYLPIEIDDAGNETLRLQGEPVPARRYRLRNPEHEIDITVWYEQETRRWLSLESRVSGDRVIRYLPTSVQANTSSETAVSAPERSLNASR